MATYYLSPTGSDTTGTGTISLPWFTLEKAWDYVAAGDTVYMRGGTYEYLKTQWLTGVSGTLGNYISILNYPGEIPLIRPAVGWTYDGWYYGILFQSMNYLYIKGLDVGYFVYQQTSCCRGIMAQHISNSVFENISCHHCELGMMLTGNSGSNLILNSDFYENYDPYSSPAYNNGDGLDVSSIPNSYNNTIRGCRAWWNADDGFDFWASEGIVTVENCWAWSNGYQEDHVSFNPPPMIGNDGNGFKLGQVNETTATTRRYLYNCISVLNRVNNYSQNTLDPQVLTCELYNCLSYGAVTGDGYQFDWAANAAINSILRNNIAYLNTAGLDSWITNDHNTWNSGYTLTVDDFVSTDYAQLAGTRLSNGSLPSITFGHIVSGSDLIDTGVDIGLPYIGTAPDLGPFEYTTTYYISPAGDDIGIGSIDDPFETLERASAESSDGYTINVTAGSYNITSQVSVGVGVTIVGAGKEVTTINSTYRATSFSGGFDESTILLYSTSQGTDGNQSISGITFDGGDGDANGSTNAIMVKNRGGVSIYDCIIKDFDWTGVTFTNGFPAIAPTAYATNNKLYNCTIQNCSGQAGTWEGAGLISINGQDNIEIYNNILYGDSRTEGDNGDILATHGQGHCKRIKYHDNISYKPDYDGTAWNFHLEIFNCYGGNEIYDNEFYGGDCIIDITGMYENTKGIYDYSYLIYDNLFTGTPVETYHGKYTIDIEGELNEDIYIYNNHFLNLPTPLSFTDNTYAPSQTRRIYFYYNILENLGWNDAAKYDTCINFFNGNASSVLEDIFIYNNVIESDSITHTAAFKIYPTGTITRLMIKNNIITGHTNGSYMLVDNDGTIDYLEVMNNITYGNSNSNDILWQTVGTRTNFTESGNIKSDPLFIGASDFHLQVSSPANNAGINVGLTSDYDYRPIGLLPDIGAYEYYILSEIGLTNPIILKFGIT